MKKYFLPFTVVLFISCLDDESTDCSTVLCAGPPNLAFEVILNEENVFEKGIYSAEDISVSNTGPELANIIVQETNFGNRTAQVLFLETTKWEVTTYNFDLNIGDNHSANLEVEIALSTGACCGGIPQIKNYEIDGVIQVNPNSVVTLNLN